MFAIPFLPFIYSITATDLVFFAGVVMPHNKVKEEAVLINTEDNEVVDSDDDMYPLHMFYF